MSPAIDISNPDTSTPVFQTDGAWYAIYCKPRQEFRALEQLQNQAYTCFLPTLVVDKVKNNALQSQLQPLFPRYLFIHLNQSTSNWMPIRSTRGVANVVSFANQAAKVPNDLILALQAAPVLERRRFEQNQAMTIQQGAFAGLSGVFQKILTASDGQMRAVLLVELMHKTHTLSISVSDL